MRSDHRQLWIDIDNSTIATGGSIAAEKLFCYLIDFKWTGSSWEYRKVEVLPGEFSIQNKDVIQATLKRYGVSHANKTLGVYIAMDGNEEAEIENLTTLPEKFGHQLRTARCEKNASMYTLQYLNIQWLQHSLMKSTGQPFSDQLYKQVSTRLACI